MYYEALYLYDWPLIFVLESKLLSSNLQITGVNPLLFLLTKILQGKKYPTRTMSKFIGYLQINNSLDRKPTSLIWLFISYPNQWKCCRPQEGRGFSLQGRTVKLENNSWLLSPGVVSKITNNLDHSFKQFYLFCLC